MPHDCFPESVSNTLDYVYGDFCIAQIAKSLGKQEDYDRIMARAQNYRLLFDASSGFMRGRNADGTWQEVFDPLEWGDPFCEGGAWQGSWAVPHDLAGLAELMGGEQAFAGRLDQLMTEDPVFKVGSYGMEIHEMSEMASAGFGQFVISNQPGFHIPYIFARIGKLAKTQFWVRKAMAELFSRITVHLENGRQWVIEAENNNPSHVYSEAVRWNGVLWEHHSLPHEEICRGGVLNFRMSTVAGSV